MEPLVGYDRVSEIHRGRLHRVLRARRQADDRPVVLKSVHGEYPSPRALAALRREHDILRRLEVTGAVEALGLEEQGAALYLVLQDAGPHDLRAQIRRGPASLATFLDQALQLARVLARLQERGIIHRDLNPSNIVCAEDGRLTVIDFGLATALPRLEAAISGTLDVEGTLLYLSPEQTGRMGRPLDYRSDFYALGATFYELLTGRPPFDEIEPMALVHAHLARAPVPPHERRPDVPEVVSQLVLKLLAKMPEDRYQSADGLVADLREARDRLRGDAVPSFPLGRADFSPRLTCPQRLYGRDSAQQTLAALFRRAREGGRETVLIRGAGGIGKTALAETLQPVVAEARGYFLRGRFSDDDRTPPYGALVEGLRGWIRQVLGEPDDVVVRWRVVLHAALAPNARCLLDVLPELELVLGVTPPVPEAEPLEAQNRLGLAFLALLGALARPEHPLCLFVDDLHRADAVSLKLLQVLAGGIEPGFMLLVGAWRDDDPAAPPAAELQGLRAAGSEIVVGPLEPAEVTAFCADALGATADRVRPLSTLVTQKSGGNPLFMRELLEAFYTAGLLRRDPTTPGWDWDLPGIGRADVSPSIAGLLIAVVEKLPAPVRDLLVRAACLGTRFQLRTLAAMTGHPEAELAALLAEPVAAGLLVPTSDGESTGTWRFPHERIRQAAAALLSDEAREPLHLEIGRVLLDDLTEADGDEALFRVVDHLDRGRALLPPGPARQRVAELNFQAGRRARTASAFEGAARYFAVGLECLGPEGWEQVPELTFDLHREQAECAFLIGDHETASRLVEKALGRGGTRAREAELHHLAVVRSTVEGAHLDAARWARAGLAVLDTTLPADHDVGAADAALASVAALLRDWNPEGLLDLPAMTDPDDLARMRLLSDLATPAYLAQLPLHSVVLERMVRLSVERGLGVYSAHGFTMYALSEARRGAWARSYVFGRLGVDVGRRFGHPGILCRALTVFATQLSHWGAPMRNNPELLREAVQLGRTAGELQFTSYASASLAVQLVALGKPLTDAGAEIEAALGFGRMLGDQTLLDVLIPLRQLVRALQGRTSAPGSLGGPDFDEAALAEHTAGNPTARWTAECFALQAAVLFGDAAGAPAPPQHLGGGGAVGVGTVLLVRSRFWAALARAGRSDATEPGALAELEAARLELAAWADVVAANFHHQERLIAAEQARLEGRPIDAMALYDEAIEGARGEGFTADQALANELAGRFYLAQGRDRIAGLYLRSARDGYEAWGASGKTAALEARWPELLRPEHGTASSRPASSTNASATLPMLDLMAVLKASEALAGEVVLERLLTRVMRVVLQAAGAERGVLFLEQPEGLMVRARASADSDVELACGSVGGEPPGVGAIALFVRRTRRRMVVDDAERSAPELHQRGVRSALCLPIVQQSRLAGVLYLENHLATHAFDMGRADMLALMSTQLAIALENGRMFEALRVENAERELIEARLRQLNEDLEARVRGRTAELASANAELERSNNELEQFAYIASHDLQEPLRMMAGFGDLLQRRYGEAFDDRGRYFLQQVVDGALRMQRMVRDLLAWSRVGTRAVRSEPTALEAVMAQVEVDLSVTIRESEARVEHGPLPEVRGDPGQLRQLLLNLVGNAIKYHAGAPPHVRVTAVRNDGEWVVSVEDNGIGVDEADRERIFQIFQRLDPQRPGTGIGLAIARRIVEGHGGRIWVDPAPDLGGSWFRFTLPAEP